MDIIQDAKKELEKKLHEYGSVELMANLAIKETRDQSSTFHNPANPMGENPFVAYSLGLFLSNNNLDAGEPHPNQVDEFLELLTDYFDKFKLSLMQLDNPNPKPEDFIIFESKLQKIVDDGNPHIYPDQKNEYYEKVFLPLNNHFISKYGFSVEYATNFADCFIKRVQDHMQKRHNLACEKYIEVKEKLQKPESENLLKEYEKNNVTPEQMALFYVETLFLTDSNSVLTINVENYCSEQNLEDKDTCRKYLNTFSCSFGEQLVGFDDLLSDNIIFYKPIIKLDEDTFFLPKFDFLHDKLDLLLEFLLEAEKQNTSDIWNKFVILKSKYLEKKVYEFFSRIFPSKCIFQNAYYWIGSNRKEVDLLVIYDNKIFIVESKSGKLPLSAKREGNELLKIRLLDLIKKALSQGIDARNYITSQSKVTFWKDEQKNKILVEIDSLKTDYEFFFIDVTLEHLGGLGTNLKNIDAFNFFKDNEYPWAVYLHDLDVVTDLLHEPIYFIHYIEQRLATQEQNVFESPMELSFLAYYLRNGIFSKQVVIDSRNVAKVALFPDLIDSIDDYYLFSKKKPQLVIPRKLEGLLLNMQKYCQKGFTNVTSLLLDFPQDRRKLIADSLDKKFNKTAKTGIPDGFMALLGEPYDIGFSYYTANNMTNFYKGCKIRSKQRKLENNITRWATIGRNVLDKKNHATFFIYDN